MQEPSLVKGSKIKSRFCGTHLHLEALACDSELTEAEVSVLETSLHDSELLFSRSSKRSVRVMVG